MKRSSTFLQTLAVAATILSAASILEAQQVTVPEGTVVELRMETGLNSRDSRTSDMFKASVSRTVWIDGKVAIPENSTIDGRVTTVQPAERSSHSGVIGVEFYQISVNGRSYSMEGALTSLKADERKQIIDEESRITGRSSTKRTILFIGGGAGVGAAIGAIADGGKGAGIGALAGGGIGTLGVLLSRGAEAEVPAGADVAMQLVRPLTVNADNRVRQTTSNDRTLYTAAAIVRSAQTALRQRKYYDGLTNGRLDDATRRAIAHYQIDSNQPATGDLDEATAASLGLVRTGTASQSLPDVTGRQLALDISQKASSLLQGYQSSLGVQVADIRSKPRLSESDLDLLLQVQAFEKAAIWYEQASRTQNGQPAIDNFGRILLRSADRVEDGILAASQQNRSFADSWSSIQTNLRRIRVDSSTFGR